LASVLRLLKNTFQKKLATSNNSRKVVWYSLGQEKTKNIATNSLILIFVQGVTLCTGIAKAMLFSRTLDKFDYGTYNQGLFVVSFVSPFVALGLANAVNYFYNKTEQVNEKQTYVNTIFSMTIILGIFCALGIIGFRQNIADYFDNSALFGLLIYVAFTPLLANIIALYQPLFISNGMAKAIAVRNLIVSLLQLIVLGTISIYSHNIALMFIVILTLDLLQIVIFGGYFNYKCFKIKLLNISRKYIAPILTYAVPVALATTVGTISLSIDKMIIGRMMSVEDFALYSNVSKELPFNIISNSFTIIITPVIIGFFAEKQIDKLKNAWSSYLEIGYLSTWALCCGAIVCSRELVLFLYTDRYIDGLSIFVVYLFVTMIRFTYFGLILTASGKTKWIFIYSLFSLVLNLVLSIILFGLLGIMGPSISNLISNSLLAVVMFLHNVKVLKVKTLDVINIRCMFFFIIQLVCTGLLIYCIDEVIISQYISVNIVKLIVKYFMFLLILFLLCRKRIKTLILELNRIQ